MNGSPQRLDIRFTLRWEHAWHVGSGFGSATVDRLICRRPAPKGGKGSPFVPGSQIKGVLRHHCERLAALFGCDVVPPHQFGPRPSDGLLANFRPLRQSSLLIDRLFGSRYQGECLFVEDATPAANGEPEPSRPHSRTALDRVSGTARERTLFVTEVVEGRDTIYHSRLRARHPAGVLTQLEEGFPYEYALLLAGLFGLDALGGDKSTGLGACTVAVDNDRVRWNDQPDFPVADALVCFAEADWKEWLDLARGEATA